MDTLSRTKYITQYKTITCTSTCQIYVAHWWDISKEGKAQKSRFKNIAFSGLVLFRVYKFWQKQKSNVDTNRFLSNTSTMITVFVKIRLPFPASCQTLLLNSDSVKNSTLNFFDKGWATIFPHSCNQCCVVEFSFFNPINNVKLAKCYTATFLS